jgi:hypothetical protein
MPYRNKWRLITYLSIRYIVYKVGKAKKLEIVERTRTDLVHKLQSGKLIITSDRSRAYCAVLYLSVDVCP